MREFGRSPAKIAIQDPAARLELFKSDLRALDASAMVQKHVTFGQCFVLDEAQHFELRSRVAARFEVHPNEVIVVGSAKLGFSIKSTRRYQAFGETSDIDVAIVSHLLFDRIWQEVFDYENRGGTWNERLAFKEYLFKGWIRPDLLPRTPSFPFGKQIWDWFLDETRKGDFGPYRLRAAVYRSWNFLERYQQMAVIECQTDLEEET